MAFQGGAGVDIEQSAVLVGKLLQGKLFGLKLTVCVMETRDPGGRFLPGLCGAASGGRCSGRRRVSAACGVLSVLGCVCLQGCVRPAACRKAPSGHRHGQATCDAAKQALGELGNHNGSLRKIFGPSIIALTLLKATG